MTLHLCSTFDPNCWRCDLASDELREPVFYAHRPECDCNLCEWARASDASTSPDLPSSTGGKGDSR